MEVGLQCGKLPSSSALSVPEDEHVVFSRSDVRRDLCEGERKMEQEQWE